MMAKMKVHWIEEWLDQEPYILGDVWEKVDNLFITSTHSIDN